MADKSCGCVLEEISSGLVGPLYSEGAVVHAQDLTLDRTSQSEALWRMRRLLHGWGVVAGLQVSLERAKTETHVLRVQAGYGVAPDGEELYLPTDIAIKGVLGQMFACCGPSAPGCDLDAAGQPLPDLRRRDAPVTAWVVLRSTWVEAAPRAGLPLGCDHPGNALSPSRSCNRLTVELRCVAPKGHTPKPDACATLQAILCEGAPVPMDLVEAEGSVLALARLVWTGRALTLDTSVRQRLLPAAVIQKYLMACQCEAEKPKDDDDDPVRPGRPPFRWGDDIIVANPGLIGTPREAEYRGVVALMQQRGIPLDEAVAGTPEVLAEKAGLQLDQARWFLETTQGFLKAQDPIINPGPRVPLRRLLVTHDTGAVLEGAEKDALTSPEVLDAIERTGMSVDDILTADDTSFGTVVGLPEAQARALQDGVRRLVSAGPRIRF